MQRRVQSNGRAVSRSVFLCSIGRREDVHRHRGTDCDAGGAEGSTDVLGPKGDRSAFDRLLPKEIAVSAISRTVGHTPVDEAFGRVEGREKWAIPWFEDDMALAMFGPEVAKQTAAIFNRIGGRLPRAGGNACPTGLAPDARPWTQVAKEYTFVDELAACRDNICGAGNLERFDYWLGTLRYLRAMDACSVPGAPSMRCLGN
jgi:hypothetical protein